MNKVFIFTLGAAAGSLLTWKLLEKKYKDLADEEIASVKEHYKKRAEKYDELDKFDHIRAWKDTPVVEEHPDKKDYFKQVDVLGYTNDEATVKIETGVEQIAPFVIAPEEWGEIEDYETKQLTYYADSILADESEEIIGDPEIYIGDGLDHFGEYADDAVYVRNDNLKCDYEIFKHDKTYSEVNGVDD